MGLDNGIVLKIRDTKEKERIEKKFLLIDWFDIDDAQEIEIAYFRKCWNIRGDILDILNTNHNSEEYQFVLSEENVKDIIALFKGYYKDNWDRSTTIWSWSEMKKYTMPKAIKNCKRLLKAMNYMNKHGIEYVVYFYDSY